MTGRDMSETSVRMTTPLITAVGGDDRDDARAKIASPATTDSKQTEGANSR